MNEREAQHIVRLVEAGWRMDLGEDGRELWRRMLSHHDPEVAEEALELLTAEQSQRPSISDLRQMIYRVRTDRQATPSRGLPAPAACPTCGGDRWVLYGTRRAEQAPWMKERGIEPTAVPVDEYAACPECNAGANASFTRHDGSRFLPPDPARVRERLARG